ncbi:hypothetical protein [Achromobacter xylosoxidans]|uniref:hypothetical protein n=1 Tax=Alcaligenes xylosoxydans xylosoxydans TaxID=85698 RepID=UPI00292EF64A|nr:hypothetical protein [Achromobacter xylosoxidans]WOB76268.1 hypothetical protein PZA07_12585 [Achromobacter xylosoxidans]
MMSLTLHAGPRLTRFTHIDDPGPPGRVGVTEDAIGYLFEQVAVEPDVTLGDIFRLFDLCPRLHEVFRRNYSESLCEEARKGPLPQSTRGGSPEVTEIEYLELHRRWGLDTYDNTYSGVDRLELHGQGVVLVADAPEYHVKAGERIEWSVSLTPIRELLTLPVRVATPFKICEDDLSAKAYAQTLQEARCSEITLGQFLEGIVSELSFHGNPEDKREVIASLQERMVEIDAGEAQLIPHDEVLETLDFYRAGFDAMFETLGGIKKSQVKAVLREIDDDMPVGPVMDREFAGAVVVKTQVYNLPGRAFRRTFHAA